jgi:hypothetical protein
MVDGDDGENGTNTLHRSVQASGQTIRRQFGLSNANNAEFLAHALYPRN